MIKHHIRYYPEAIAWVHHNCHKQIHDAVNPLDVYIQYELEEQERFISEKKVLGWDASPVVLGQSQAVPLTHIAGYSHNNVASAITWGVGTASLLSLVKMIWKKESMEYLIKWILKYKETMSGARCVRKQYTLCQIIWRIISHNVYM